jgi:hypothetical protein
VPDPIPPTPRFEPRALLGATFDGRYELVAHLATGGMGAVFRARHVHLRRDVAVKVLRPDLSSSPELVERFRREAEIASALQHDNIVHVTDFGRSDGYLYLVMDLLVGESLFDRLRREGPLRPEDVVRILWQMCGGLEAAHARGVVHRDLKPENVFLARSASGREVAKLLDFGIAKIADPVSGTATQAGMVVGTPEYLAPEQASGGAVDGRADLYALGLIGWRALTGRHPFSAEDPRGLLMMQATQPVPPLASARAELAAWPALAATIARACAKDPAARHPTAGALRDDLAAALGVSFVAPGGATPAAPAGVGAPFAVTPELAVRPALTEPAEAAASRRSWTRVSVGISRRARAVGSRMSAALGRARDLAARAPVTARTALREVGVRPGRAAAIAAVVALILLVVLAVASHRGRPVAEARLHLADGRAEDARRVVEAALRGRPEDHDLLLLRGRALHRIPGQIADGIDGYRAARAAGPLDAEALADLAADLARERSVADRAALLLREVGAEAAPALLVAAHDGPGLQRLRALALLRDLGAEERLDRAAAYAALLSDPECDVRRAAARRLGELGDPAALPPLRDAAAARTGRRGLLGRMSRAPACGAPEAAQAARRIEAVR